MQNLTLYYKPTCPFCVKILYFMKQNNMTLPLKDTANTDTREELIAIGGKGQVPCLVIDNEAMYESDDIITWLKNNYV